MTVLESVDQAAEQACRWLQKRKPQLALVLGSGWSGLITLLDDPRELAFDQLSGFPSTSVSGHCGALYSGWLFGQEVLVFSGRYHYYEGYSPWQVTAQVRLAAALGCTRLLLTNAVGGISAAMKPGTFVLLDDHINLSGINPLIGRRERDFIDLSNIYSSSFYGELKSLLRDEDVVLNRGVLAWMPGPSYETPAEIRALEHLGADVVSMSTVAEAVVAALYRFDVVALSMITNFAAGKSSVPLAHEEVIALGKRSELKAAVLIKKLLSCWSV